MSQPTPTMARTVGRAKPDIAWAGRAGKVLAASISAGTGLVSIFAFARSYGLAGGPQEGHLALGGFSAAWVGVTPATDTAFAIDDTLHLVATAKDSRGSALVGAPIRWTSDDPAVATVDASGAVVARGAGATAIAVTVGDRVGRARIVVAQRPVALRVVEGDSVVGEGERRALRSYAVDARGYPIRSSSATRWSSADTAVATIDSGGTVTGVGSGRAHLDATLHGMSVRTSIQVRAVPGTVAVLSGAGQRATTDARLEQPVVVRVLSTRGRPVPGATVHFAAGPLAGRAEPVSAVTDPDGRARTWWTLGAIPGRQRLLASVNEVDSSAVVRAEAEPTAANLRATALAAGQSGGAGEPLAEPVGVLLTDSLGRPVVDLAVSWLAPNGGTVVPAATRTDSLGEARAQWTLGPRAGSQQLRALVGSSRLLPPVLVAAVARAGAPAAATLVSGDQQRGAVALPLVRPLVVRVRDRAGNAVPGVAVSFTASGGTLADSVAATDSTGSAAVRWTLGPRAGTQRLTAQVAGLDAPLTASARARAGAPASVTFDSVTPPRRGAPLAVTLTVSDALGNPIAGARTRLRARRGTVAPATVTTDSLGRATARLAPAAAGGDETVTASVAGAADAAGALAIAIPASPSAAATAPASRAAPARPAAPKTPARSTRSTAAARRARAR